MTPPLSNWSRHGMHEDVLEVTTVLSGCPVSDPVFFVHGLGEHRHGHRSAVAPNLGTRVARPMRTTHTLVGNTGLDG